MSGRLSVIVEVVWVVKRPKASARGGYKGSTNNFSVEETRVPKSANDVLSGCLVKTALPVTIQRPTLSSNEESL